VTDETTQEDLLAWLDTAISLREERAQRLGGRPFDVRNYGALVTFEGAELHEDEIAHIVLHDPPAVLRRCAADRESLNAYAETLKLHNKYRDRIQEARDRGGLPDAKDLAVWSEASSELAVMVGFVLNLAKGYGWGAGEDV
jgi:hypothetical protein